MKRERKSAHIEKGDSGKGQDRNMKRPVKNETVSAKVNIGIKKKMLWISVIAAVTLIAYSPVFNNEITSWDDEFYINTNPYLKELSVKTVSELFKTDTYYMGNYHPLSMISLSIDYALGGEDEKGNIDPFMFHLTNILLHILTCVFVFLTLLALFRNINIAVIVGILFGVHPMHVESVAWISERKDVLYAFFFVLSIWAYIKYTDIKKTKWYWLSLAWFVLSLFSKGQAVSLAVTIFFIDYLRNRKLTERRVILEKIPFLVLALIFGYLAIQAQKQSEALVDEQAYTMVQRIGIASYAFIMYLAKLILPLNLSAIYPYTDIIGQTIPSYYYLMIIPILFIVYLFFLLIKKSKKDLVFGIAFFVVNIVLLLQFIPVGSAIYADRYVYIPSIGFFIVFALLITKVLQNQKRKPVVLGVLGVYVCVLGVLTFERTDIWQNSRTLWTDTVEKSPEAVTAWNNLGSYKDKQASIAKDFSRAISGKPDYKNAYFNRGVSGFEVGKLTRDTALIQSSLKDFDKALELDGRFTDAYFNRANAKSELGLLDASIKDFNIAIGLNPEESDYYANRGVAYGKLGKIDDAIRDFDYSLKLNPLESSVYSNRGRAKMLKGSIPEAIADYNQAIELNPLNYTAFFNRAIAKQKQKDYEGAKADYEHTLKLRSDMGEVYLQRGLMFLEMNEKENACNDFSQANRMGIGYAAVLMQQSCK
jgi:tetratricopeptide (TPR) repeat protein